MQNTITNRKDTLILTAGIIGVVGCMTVVITHFIALFLLDPYNAITETISDLVGASSPVFVVRHSLGRPL